MKGWVDLNGWVHTEMVFVIMCMFTEGSLIRRRWSRVLRKRWRWRCVQQNGIILHDKNIVWSLPYFTLPSVPNLLHFSIETLRVHAKWWGNFSFCIFSVAWQAKANCIEDLLKIMRNLSVGQNGLLICHLVTDHSPSLVHAPGTIYLTQSEIHLWHSQRLQNC